MKGKAIFLSVLMVVLLMSGFIYFFFNGNPITKEKSREIVSSYLEENYPEESFKITNIAYYPGEGTYIVHVISADEKIEGNIDVRNGRIITEGGEFPFRE
jgi:flagellar basal body-associated protein FliL